MTDERCPYCCAVRADYPDDADDVVCITPGNVNCLRRQLAARDKTIEELTAYVRSKHNGYSAEARAVMPGLKEPEGLLEAVKDLVEERVQLEESVKDLQIKDLTRERDEARAAAAAMGAFPAVFVKQHQALLMLSGVYWYPPSGKHSHSPAIYQDEPETIDAIWKNAMEAIEAATTPGSKMAGDIFHRANGMVQNNKPNPGAPFLARLTKAESENARLREAIDAMAIMGSKFRVDYNGANRPSCNGAYRYTIQGSGDPQFYEQVGAFPTAADAALAGLDAMKETK